MASLDFTLGLAGPHDARAIAAMSRDLIEAGLGWQYQPERIACLIRDTETVTLVARDGEKTVGFAIMTYGDERAHLVLLAVSPTYRRRGVGRGLLLWLIDSAITAGIASVQLELRAGNAAACAFYRSLGFAETRLVSGYYRGREPALCMVRVLRKPDPPSFNWHPPTLGH